MMEMAWLGGGILLGGALHWLHRRRLDVQAARQREASWRQMQRERGQIAEARMSAQHYRERIAERDLEAAVAEGYIEGYLDGQRERYTQDGLQRVAERFSKGEAATVMLRKRRMNNAGY